MSQSTGNIKSQQPSQPSQPNLAALANAMSSDEISIKESIKKMDLNGDLRRQESLKDMMHRSRSQEPDDELNGSSAKTPFIIGVAGGSASGKSTVCRKIIDKLGQDSMRHGERRVTCISQDSFYRQLDPSEQDLARKGKFDFDHPDALDDQLMYDVMMEISLGHPVEVPIWDFITHSRKQETLTVQPAEIVLFEGILVFFFQNIRDLFHMKLFVEADDDTRLARRVIRDVEERGRELESVLNQYICYVKPAFDEFCQPTKKYADVIIPRGADNEVAINLIGKHLEHILKKRNLAAPPALSPGPSPVPIQPPIAIAAAAVVSNQAPPAAAPTSRRKTPH